MTMKGVSLFYENRDVEAITCLVCGKQCKLVDTFFQHTFMCLDANTPWHQQAEDIYIAYKETPSPSLRKLLRSDILEIVKRKQQL